MEADKDQRYPRCIEGERTCPPEDVGGAWGYMEYLEALADPEHERHEDFMEWSGPFGADKFDVAETTEEMQQGLRNWRSL